MTSTPGKTRMAERLCSAVISLTRPSPAAQIVPPSHAAAARSSVFERASATNLVMKAEQA